ncbi:MULTISPECIES: hypothetical protein [unclassified Rhodococcus (in: high G+C Gram-positive bacteria)]|uniref:hypothetical protein n=1 Tax=unclassified Rhodococcus (in: high G+C Gram-positive bacteria) TaxID=192944 RepID=UPI00163AECE8|nr:MULTISPECIES: hypothetical protein [unclassified Rhodococcus (in: high G+C Gram-positive bacteria)]MBC2644697.1 hypothetical protein [Rhodococcus sp. 3A]MBC2898296.1 hypothetical protein [Rhodococcus sp. 4CII]
MLSLFLHAIAAFLYLFVRSAWRRPTTGSFDDCPTRIAACEELPVTETMGPPIWGG